MRFVHAWLISGLWLAWCAGWLLASAWSKPVLRQENPASRAAHQVPLLIAVLLMVIDQFAVGPLGARFLPRTEAAFWVGAVLVFAGLVWSALARAWLGGNWSAAVTVKHDHALIRTGPYRWTRHPIYTGILVAFVGSVIALGQWRGVVALALLVFAFRRKLAIEERFMTVQFPDDYARYQAEVPALVPGLGRRGP